jgi:hypothetical protein
MLYLPTGRIGDRLSPPMPPRSGHVGRRTASNSPITPTTADRGRSIPCWSPPVPRDHSPTVLDSTANRHGSPPRDELVSKAPLATSGIPSAPHAETGHVQQTRPAAICVVPDRLRCGQLSRLPAVGSQTCRNTCAGPLPTSYARNQSSLGHVAHPDRAAKSQRLHRRQLAEPRPRLRRRRRIG